MEAKLVPHTILQIDETASLGLMDGPALVGGLQACSPVTVFPTKESCLLGCWRQASID